MEDALGERDLTQVHKLHSRYRYSPLTHACSLKADQEHGQAQRTLYRPLQRKSINPAASSAG